MDYRYGSQVYCCLDKVQPAFARLEWDLPCVGNRDGKKVDRGKKMTRARFELAHATRTGKWTELEIPKEEIS